MAALEEKALSFCELYLEGTEQKVKQCQTNSHPDRISPKPGGDHDLLRRMDILQWIQPAGSTSVGSNSQCNTSNFHLSGWRPIFWKPHLLLWMVVPWNYWSRCDGEWNLFDSIWGKGCLLYWRWSKNNLAVLQWAMSWLRIYCRKMGMVLTCIGISKEWQFKWTVV